MARSGKSRHRPGPDVSREPAPEAPTLPGTPDFPEVLALPKRPASNEERVGREARAFFRGAARAALASGVPFLVGGAFAFEMYTGISRLTKDFDIFVRRSDVRRVLGALAEAGYRTEMTSTQWLAKAYAGDAFVDVIFGSANGLGDVDDEWFVHGVENDILGIPLQLCAVEEVIWSKAFVMDRERYDGADIAHLIRAHGERLDWERLLRHFGGDLWPVLFSHLMLFRFIYPSERAHVPEWVMDRLLSRLRDDLTDSSVPTERLCRGTLLSMTQYDPDIAWWGYRDARVRRKGP